MTDYAAEQEEEVCALQAILMDDIQEVEPGDPDGLPTTAKCWQVAVRPEGDDADASVETELRMSLTFAHTPSYPDEPPLLRVRSVRGVSKADAEELQRVLEQQASESLGMAMMFTLATSAREWLRDKAHYTAAGDVEDQAARRAAAEAEEEARRLAVRLAGTPVTVETYAAWWARFSAERQLEEASLEAAADPDKGKRLSGKRYFETRGDKALEEEDEEEDEGDEVEDAIVAGDQGDSDDSDDSDFDPNVLGSDDDEEAFLESYASGGK